MVYSELKSTVNYKVFQPFQWVNCRRSICIHLHVFIVHGTPWFLKDFSAVSKCQTYLHKYGSQACVLRLRNIVREAFVMSVICKPPFEPPVMFWSMKKNKFLWAINFKRIIIIWYLVTISFIMLKLASREVESFWKLQIISCTEYLAFQNLPWLQCQEVTDK